MFVDVVDLAFVPRGGGYDWMYFENCAPYCSAIVVFLCFCVSVVYMYIMC